MPPFLQKCWPSKTFWSEDSENSSVSAQWQGTHTVKVLGHCNLIKIHVSYAYFCVAKKLAKKSFSLRTLKMYQHKHKGRRHT
jgi:hypothetical protein